jgi:hypothetical protein
LRVIVALRPDAGGAEIVDHLAERGVLAADDRHIGGGEGLEEADERRGREGHG